MYVGVVAGATMESDMSEAIPTDLAARLTALEERLSAVEAAFESGDRQLLEDINNVEKSVNRHDDLWRTLTAQLVELSRRL